MAGPPWRLRDGAPVEPLRQRTAERINNVARLGRATVAGGGAGQVVVSIPRAREKTIRSHTRSVTRLIVTVGTDRAWLVTGGKDGIVTVADEGRLDRPTWSSTSTPRSPICSCYGTACWPSLPSRAWRWWPSPDGPAREPDREDADGRHSWGSLSGMRVLVGAS